MTTLLAAPVSPDAKTVSNAAMAYSKWQRSVTWDKNDSRGAENKAVVRQNQEQLLAALADRPARASQHLRQSVGGLSAFDTLVPYLTPNRTAGEMSQPPDTVERCWHADFVHHFQPSGSNGQPSDHPTGHPTGLPRTLAAQPVFWFACHTIWIANGVFGNDLRTVFCGTSTDTEQKVRNFLRWVSGLPLARGSASVITDCRVSRGWWRMELAYEAYATLNAERALPSHDHRAGALHPVPPLTVEKCHDLLYSKAVWKHLVELSVSKVAAANAPRARAALIAALEQTGKPATAQQDGEVSCESASTPPKKPPARPVTGRQVHAAIVELGRLASGFSLHQCSWDDLVDAALRGLKSTR